MKTYIKITAMSHGMLRPQQVKDFRRSQMKDSRLVAEITAQCNTQSGNCGSHFSCIGSGHTGTHVISYIHANTSLFCWYSQTQAAKIASYDRALGTLHTSDMAESTSKTPIKWLWTRSTCKADHSESVIYWVMPNDKKISSKKCNHSPMIPTMSQSPTRGTRVFIDLIATQPTKFTKIHPQLLDTILLTY